MKYKCLHFQVLIIIDGSYHKSISSLISFQVSCSESISNIKENICCAWSFHHLSARNLYMTHAKENKLIQEKQRYSAG